MNDTTLSLTAGDHRRLRAHLHSGDGLEAAAILICAKTPPPRRRLLVKEVILVPYAACPIRTRDRLAWPGEYLEQAIDKGQQEGLSLILLHSHPGGMLEFSDIDDDSDRIAVSSLHHAYGAHHGSAIMVGDGRMMVRTYTPKMKVETVDLVSVIGDDLTFYWSATAWPGAPLSRPVAFTSQMGEELSRLRCVIIGVSGIGSIVAEQAARLGFGTITLIDHDVVEFKNLNRILNSQLHHARDKTLKTTMMVEAISSYRESGDFHDVPISIITRQAILAASQGDVIWCCVDTLDARQIADLLSAHFLLPLIDVGVTIPTRRTATGFAIAEVCGRVDYVHPGGSNLRDRGVYTDETLRIEQIRRNDPKNYENQVATGYFRGTVEEAPSVISLNMRAASACVSEFIARAYPYRLAPNRLYARTSFLLAEGIEEFSSEDSFSASQSLPLAGGDQEPLLGVMDFGTQ